MKKFLATFLAVAMIICMLPTTTLVHAADPDGSAENPYIITTAEQLQAIAGTNTEGKYYELGNDIDLSGIANWKPIGDQTYYFKGNFDGKGYTISNLKMTTAEMYAGLFGRVFSPAVIKNVNVTDVNITLTGATGSSGLFASALVARNQGGNIYNCYTSGTITVTEGKVEAVRIGGIAGYSQSINGSTADIINCISDVDISFTYNVDFGSQKDVFIGGVVGGSEIAADYVATIANSANRGDIVVGAAEGITWPNMNYLYVGGVIGKLEGIKDSTTQPALNNCYNAGTITGVTHGTNALAGAIYGRLRNTNAQNLYTVDVGTGLDGYDIEGNAIVTVKTADEMMSSSFAETMSTGAETLNSGVLASSSVQAMYWAPVKDGYPVHAANKYGTAENPYLIYDADDLKGITAGLDKHYKLMANIDLSGIANWAPIGTASAKFKGSFDGNGYTVSNMKVTSVNGQCLGGLFGMIEYPAVVKNVTLANASVSIDHNFSSASFGGLLVAHNLGGTINNCKVTGSLSVTNAQAKTVYLGGVVGISKTNGADKAATVVNCISDVDITLTCPSGGETYIGGIVAQAHAADNTAYTTIVANCASLGDITVNNASGNYVGGIVGWMESAKDASATKSELHNCYSAGSISGLTHEAYSVNTGAIYGRLRYTTVSNVYALSDVATAHPGVDIQSAASVTGKTADEMKSASFALTLTEAADALNLSVDALSWMPTTGGYPVLTSNRVGGTSMTLGNNLALNFYYDGTPADGTYAIVTHTKADGTTKETKLETWTQNSQGLYRVTYTGVAAKEMGDTMMVVFYDVNDNAVCAPKSDSVVAYINRTMDAEAENTLLIDVCVDLLNYGAAAQNAFDYDTDNLVNKDLEDDQKELATPTVTDSSVKCEATVGASLLLENDITMRLYFNATMVTNEMSAVVSYTDHYDNSKEYTVNGSDFVTKGSNIYIPITGLVIADYDCDVTVTIKDSNGTVLYTVTDSMTNYVARALEAGDVDDIYTAIMALGASADTYFDSLK